MVLHDYVDRTVEIPDEDIDMGPSIEFVHEEELDEAPETYQFSFPVDPARLVQESDYFNETDDDDDDDHSTDTNSIVMDVDDNDYTLLSIAPDS